MSGFDPGGCPKRMPAVTFFGSKVQALHFEGPSDPPVGSTRFEHAHSPFGGHLQGQFCPESSSSCLSYLFL
eukprot:881432-Pelagomonas_calceolata.AAC.7